MFKITFEKDKDMDDSKNMKEKKSFEEAFENLKEITELLETNNEISIDELLKKYEIGLEEYSYCMNILEETQKKIKIIESKFQ